MTNENITFQFAEPQHLTALAEVERLAAEQFPADRLPESLRHTTVSAERLETAQRVQNLWVALRNEKPIGFVMLETHGEFALLAEVSVLPAFSQRGIGHYLVDHALVAARQRGFSGVGLTTFLDLPWNAPFYQKVGFTLVGDEQFPVLEQFLREERGAGLVQRVAMYYYF